MKLAIDYLDSLLKKGKPEGKIACLYSGGLDSSVAYRYYNGHKFTIKWMGFPTKDDDCGGLPISVTKRDIRESMGEGIFDLFDRPVVETGIFPLYIAYKKLAKMGYTHIVTGDGGDELFLGYKYSKLAYFKPKIVYQEIVRHLFSHHAYIANTLANHFGVTVCSPFLQPEVIKFALDLPLKYKCNLFKDKIILRKLMEGRWTPRPKYYFHNPIQEWLGIGRKEKDRWFLDRWIESKT